MSHKFTNFFANDKNNSGHVTHGSSVRRCFWRFVSAESVSGDAEVFLHGLNFLVGQCDGFVIFGR